MPLFTWSKPTILWVQTLATSVFHRLGSTFSVFHTKLHCTTMYFMTYVGDLIQCWHVRASEQHNWRHACCWLKRPLHGRTCSTNMFAVAFTRTYMFVEHVCAYRAGRVHFAIDSWIITWKSSTWRFSYWLSYTAIHLIFARRNTNTVAKFT
jgi:hypothetical protein